MGIDKQFKDIVGKTFTEAYEILKAEGYKVRVVSENGVLSAVTCDLNVMRANLTLVDNVVTRAYAG